MLVTFSSSATSDLVMFGETARELLQRLGKTPGADGAVMPEEFPVALQRLGAIPPGAAGAVAAEPPATAGDAAAETVDLAVRAYPFIAMIRQAEREQAPILWHCPEDFFAAP